jgi:hypothetical protein
MKQSNLEKAQKLAQYLDQDDFASAAALMAKDCVYDTKGVKIVGPAQIVGSYQEHSQYARKTFDSVIYKSEVRGLSENEFEMTYFDVISKNGKTHTYSCKQIIHFNKDQKVALIRHQEIPEEYNKLLAFYKEVGLG